MAMRSATVTLEGLGLHRKQGIILSIIVLLFSPQDVLAVGTFESTPPHVNGAVTTCVGRQISFTCSYTSLGGTVTRWLFHSPSECSLSIDHEASTASGECSPFTVQRFSNTTQDMLSSTVVASAATSLTGTVVQCTDRLGTNFTPIGDTNVSICVVDIPSNLTILDGSHLSWSGPTCIGSSVVYGITVTRGGDVNSAMNFNVTSSTSTTLNGLDPNQSYTVSVLAYGSSCSTQPATASFTTPAEVGQITTGSSSMTTSDAGSPPGGSGTDGAAVGAGVTVVILAIIAAVVAAIVIIILIRRYKRGDKQGSHEYTEIDDVQTLPQKIESEDVKAPSLPPARKNTETQKGDSNSAPPDGTSVDPPRYTGSTTTKNGPDLDKNDSTQKPVQRIVGGYTELDDLDPKPPEESGVMKEPGVDNNETTQNYRVTNVKGHPYHELDELVASKPQQPLLKVDEPSGESEKVNPDAPNEERFAGRVYSEIDKVARDKARKKKAEASSSDQKVTDADAEVPPLPPPYSPAEGGTGTPLGEDTLSASPDSVKPRHNTTTGHEAADRDHTDSSKPQELTSTSTSTGLVADSNSPPPKKPPRRATGPPATGPPAKPQRVNRNSNPQRSSFPKAT